jgi:hypothetical protein
VLRKTLAGVFAAAALLALPANAPAANPAAAKPVPSLTPAETAALWQRLVGRPHVFAARDCVASRLVFYAATDWLRLATKLAASASPCAQYFISVPPLAADHTRLRGDQAWRIRALGPNFHPLAEINFAGWTNFVTAGGGTWYAAGVEARRRMAAAGFDVTLGDSWIVNELSSAVRQGTGVARANARDFVRGLYEGDGSLPPTRGAVFITGLSQGTQDLSIYQARLEDWYEDAAFWNDMGAYVTDWSQELYGDVRNYAVPGSDVATRVGQLNAYLQHEATLARVAPDRATTARSFLAAAYSPLANAAWRYETAYGWTDVTYDLMQDYVTAQVHALRAASPSRFGFAWAPKNADAVSSTQFAAQTGTLLDRLAAAIADPNGACTGAWCTAKVDGAAFNIAWQAFGAWRPSQLAFVSAPQALVESGVSQPLLVQLRTSTGVPYTVGPPLAVSVTSTSPTGSFAPSSDGPWTSSLATAIAAGSGSLSFYYRDTRAGAPILTAAAIGKTSAAQPIAIVGTPKPGTRVSFTIKRHRARPR